MLIDERVPGVAAVIDFTACCVSLDGGVLVSRLSEGSGDPEILASGGSVMGKPMTIVVVDSSNTPTLFTLSRKGRPGYGLALDRK